MGESPAVAFIDNFPSVFPIQLTKDLFNSVILGGVREVIPNAKGTSHPAPSFTVTVYVPLVRFTTAELSDKLLVVALAQL